MKAVVIYLLRFYQSALSPYLGGRCRFVPSCSNYAIEAIQSEGVMKGMYFVMRRLARCHPFGGSGLDPFESGHKHHE